MIIVEIRLGTARRMARRPAMGDMPALPWSIIITSVTETLRIAAAWGA
jgi:hypothetical protein